MNILYELEEIADSPWSFASNDIKAALLRAKVEIMADRAALRAALPLMQMSSLKDEQACLCARAEALIRVALGPEG